MEHVRMHTVAVELTTDTIGVATNQQVQYVILVMLIVAENVYILLLQVSVMEVLQTVQVVLIRVVVVKQAVVLTIIVMGNLAEAMYIITAMVIRYGVATLVQMNSYKTVTH